MKELGGFKQILRMYLFHSWQRLKAGTSITKGYECSPSAWGWEQIKKGYTPGLEAFEGFLLTTCFWEQGLLFHDKTPFRVSPKLCYGLGSGNYILCLNALMFYWERLRASLLYALLPETIYLQKLDNKICQSTRGCPWVPLQSSALRALHPPTPGACSNSCASSQWCHPTVSSSVIPFSSFLQYFPVSGSFPMSQFFP